MTIAAIPKYLGKDFSTASPALRFNLLLKIWTKDWRKDKSNLSLDALQSIHSDGARCLNSMADRQSAIINGLRPSERLTLVAQSTAPFVTGLGIEHPLGNGFAFLNPYGLPYLPGSGVKGVLRRAAEELACGEWSDEADWNNEKIDALFGLEPESGDADHARGALSFWDVIPSIKGEKLTVEVMTPHQAHYYQKGDPPHDSGDPNPIFFLTVPPGSKFTFHVACDLERLRRNAMELSEDDHWKNLLVAAFEHACEWMGFGAKTSVGYGAMRRDLSAESDLAERRAEAEKEKRRTEELARLSPVEREIAEILDSRTNEGEPESTTIYLCIKNGKWEGKDKVSAARWLKTELEKVRRSSLKNSAAKRKHDQRLDDVRQWLEDPHA